MFFNQKWNYTLGGKLPNDGFSGVWCSAFKTPTKPVPPKSRPRNHGGSDDVNVLNLVLNNRVHHCVQHLDVVKWEIDDESWVCRRCLDTVFRDEKTRNARLFGRLTLNVHQGTVTCLVGSFEFCKSFSLNLLLQKFVAFGSQAILMLIPILLNNLIKPCS